MELMDRLDSQVFGVGAGKNTLYISGGRAADLIET